MIIEAHINQLLRERLPEMTASLSKRIEELRRAQNELAAIAISINRQHGFTLRPGQFDGIVQRMHRALNGE